MLAPGAIVDPEDLRVPGEQPGTPIVILDDMGELPHGHLFRARQGKSLLLVTVLVPDTAMQRELRDMFTYRLVQAGEVHHPNLLPTYGCAPLPLGEDGFETLFVVRPDPGCPSLRQWLHEVWQAGHVLDPLNAVAIAVQVCEALAALHDKYAHGYVTADTVFMYPTGGMPQALLGGTGEGVLLPFAPSFERYAQAGYLPQAGRELFEPPHTPRVETDVLGAAGLVLEILTGKPLEAGMQLDHFGLPPRLQRVLEVASRPDPEERPQDILMFSKRLQAAVGLGEDPVEPTAVLEPVHHGDHADPRYPAMRARAWRPPPPPPPPWVDRVGPTPGSGAWNIGAPTPGSGAWNIGGPTPGSGAWNVGAPTPGSGAWNVGAPTPGSYAPAPPLTRDPHAGAPGSGAWNVARPPSGAWSAAPPPAPPAWQPSMPAAAPPPVPPPASPPAPPPAFGRSFPVSSDPELSPSTAEAMSLPRYDAAPPPPARPEARTKVFGGAPPPPVGAPTPPPVPSMPPAGPPPALTLPPVPGMPNKSSHSVSIMMPAPDGSVMAPLSRGPADYIIVRHGKRHGPYDAGQLERLIPMGKLRSVDAIEVQSTGAKVLAVDVPGLRPLFEARAAVEEKSVVRPLPVAPVAAPAPQADATRNRLWGLVGLLAMGLVIFAVLLALS